MWPRGTCPQCKGRSPWPRRETRPACPSLSSLSGPGGTDHEKRSATKEKRRNVDGPPCDEQSPTHDFLTLGPCDGACRTRALNVEPGATRAHVPLRNIEGADRTSATRPPSLLLPPLLLPLGTDAASFLARCQEASVGACSYFAPLRRCAPLAPGLVGAPFASATPTPLSVVLCVLVFAAPLLSAPSCVAWALAVLEGVPFVSVRAGGWPNC